MLFPLVFVASALAESPYAPQSANCPEGSLVRAASGLSSGEEQFLSQRSAVTKAALVDWLSNSNLDNVDASSFGDIQIGIAVSGGGYRAMLTGAGMIAALDNRTDGANQPGHLGGLLQATTYLSGLSGGSWLVGSLAMNNFSSVQDLQNNNQVWQLAASILDPDGADYNANKAYFDTLFADLKAKQDAGFNVSLTDLWGRALGYQMFASSEGGQGLSFSSLADYDTFTSGNMPFPIIVSDRRGIGESIISLNSTVMEFNAYEVGSWDPNLYAFTNLEYLGSDVNNGVTNGSCVKGFDNAGYIIGTSATLFNEALLNLVKIDDVPLVEPLLKPIIDGLQLWDQADGDVAIYEPNPFAGVPEASIKNDKLMTLVDGGEDNENVPLHPLIQPSRNVDVVFAMDSSADTDDDWPNGGALIATYERQFASQANGTVFPYVPDSDTFLYGGLTQQPTFFGCNRTNLTTLFAADTPESERHYPPVVVYMANSWHSYLSNKNTFQLNYPEDQVGSMIENGYNIMTQNNGTLDSEWRTCVACAVILREQQRNGESPTEQCQKCFDNYCWDGSTVGAIHGGVSRRDGKSNIVW